MSGFLMIQVSLSHHVVMRVCLSALVFEEKSGEDGTPVVLAPGRIVIVARFLIRTE